MNTSTCSERPEARQGGIFEQVDQPVESIRISATSVGIAMRTGTTVRVHKGNLGDEYVCWDSYTQEDYRAKPHD